MQLKIWLITSLVMSGLVIACAGPPQESAPTVDLEATVVARVAATVTGLRESAAPSGGAGGLRFEIVDAQDFAGEQESALCVVVQNTADAQRSLQDYGILVGDPQEPGGRGYSGIMPRGAVLFSGEVRKFTVRVGWYGGFDIAQPPLDVSGFRVRVTWKLQEKPLLDVPLVTVSSRRFRC